MKILKYIIYASGLIYLLVSFNYGVNIYDEGLTLVGGMRVLGGELPFRDFWSTTAPGTFYVSAFLQIFTKEIWLEKLISILITFFIAIKVNDISTLLTDKRQYFVFLSAIILTGFGIKYLNPSLLGLMFSILSIEYGIKYLKFSSNNNLFKSGIFIGLTSLFRLDFALYLFVPLAMSILFEIEKVEKGKNLLKVIFGILPAILLYLILGLFAGFENIIEQLIVFPFINFSTTRILPFPLIWEARAISVSISNYFYNTWIALIFLVPPFLAILNYVIYRRQRNASLYIYYGLLVLLFYNQALNRSDYTHLLPSLLLTLPLLFSLFWRVETKFYRTTAIIISSILLLIIPLSKMSNSVKKYYLQHELIRTNLPNLNHIYIDYNLFGKYSFIKELKENIFHNEPTFIGLKDMSAIESNDVLIYYVLGIKPHTKYHELQPGIADKESYQKEILRELAQKNEYVILFNEKSNQVSSGSQYFNLNLPKIYRYVIKTENIEVLANKKQLLKEE